MYFSWSLLQSGLGSQFLCESNVRDSSGPYHWQTSVSKALKLLMHLDTDRLLQQLLVEKRERLKSNGHPLHLLQSHRRKERIEFCDGVHVMTRLSTWLT